MKKFILGLVIFATGLIGFAICLVSGSVVENIYTKMSASDSLQTYSYVFSPSSILGLLVFGVITIVGLVLSIINSNEEKNNN